MRHNGGQGGNATADRALDILLLFDEAHPALTVTELQHRLGMSRSTAYRYLQSLRAYGLIEGDEREGGVRPGPLVFRLARIARLGLGLIELALPVMRELASRTGETVLLTRRAGNQVVCIERVDSPQPIRLAYERGHVLPLHAGASAKILLAYAEPGEVEAALAATPLPRYTDRTVTDPIALRRQLEQIRRAGYVVTDGEVDAGVRGVAAPIRNSQGRVVAGLSVAGLAFRLDDAALPGVVEAVRQAADAISQRLDEIGG